MRKAIPPATHCPVSAGSIRNPNTVSGTAAMNISRSIAVRSPLITLFLCRCALGMHQPNQAKRRFISGRGGDVQGKPPSYRRLLNVLSDIVSEENKKDRNHTLNEDRYRPRSSGIAVRDAG